MHGAKLRVGSGKMFSKSVAVKSAVCPECGAVLLYLDEDGVEAVAVEGDQRGIAFVERNY